MDATKQNFQIANRVGSLLEEEKCTVAQAVEILGYVSRKIQYASPVHFPAEKSVKRANSVD